MMIGTLRLQTFFTRYCAPVPDVKITLFRSMDDICSGLSGGIVTSRKGTSCMSFPDECGYTFYTDLEGNAPDISLPAPDVDLSLDENNTSRPYSLWDIVAEKSGFQPVKITGVQVFAHDIALAELEMIPVQKRGAPTPQPEIFAIPAHSLYSPEGSPSFAPKTVPPPRVLSAPIIPETVTVHLGTPQSGAQNVTVTFRSYIANVASSEVYPTWPEESLRANIHAQISLALNRIFTEWYPSRGYSFNITNSTSYDQYYVHGRTIFEPMERITDDIFNTYVRKLGTIEPYYTEYCDGKQVTSCNGMKQWGTVTQAEQGKSALQILKYYYGNNIEIIRTNNIQGIPQSYPGSPLRLGDSGPDVAVIQRQLTRIAKDYPSFGNPGTDGYFSEATQSSVKKFQKQFNLTVDGVVGRTTWYKISYIYVAVKKLAELTSEGEEPTGDQDTITGSNYPGTAIRRGDSGKYVEQIQFWLEQLAEFDSRLVSVTIDGIFGAGTESSVRVFQQVNGLLVDGVVGRQTWDALYEQYISLEDDIDSSANGYPGKSLKRGDTGDSVRRIQFWLSFISSNYSMIPALTVDGVFGAATESAVKAFQTEFGLTPDGIVGATTWDTLYQVYGDVANNLLPPNQLPGTYPGFLLRRGSSGQPVREAQYYLIVLSAYYPSIPRIALDGEFGAATESAVKAFQSLAGLSVDGIIGPATWSALYSQASKLRSSAGPMRAFILPAWPGYVIKEGDSGAAVAEVQYLLSYIAFFYENVQPPTAISGEFDTSTRLSLESYQRFFNLPVTGVVDNVTWDDLQRTLLSLASGKNEYGTNRDAEEYPGYAMKKNSASADVKTLQENMNIIANLYYTFDFVDESGIFDTDTESRVIALQKKFKLPPTGTVEKQTWDLIYAVSHGISV